MCSSNLEMAATARALSGAKQFRFDLGEKVEYGFLHATEANTAGKVLLDAEQARPR